MSVVIFFLSQLSYNAIIIKLYDSMHLQSCASAGTNAREYPDPS